MGQLMSLVYTESETCTFTTIIERGTLHGDHETQHALSCRLMSASDQLIARLNEPHMTYSAMLTVG